MEYFAMKLMDFYFHYYSLIIVNKFIVFLNVITTYYYHYYFYHCYRFHCYHLY